MQKQQKRKIQQRRGEHEMGEKQQQQMYVCIYRRMKEGTRNFWSGCFIVYEKKEKHMNGTEERKKKQKKIRRKRPSDISS